MTRKSITHIKHLALIAGIVLCLLVCVQVALSSNVDPMDKYAWGTSVGWINFDPAGYEGVTVYADHLEGYAWGENVGWIRMGTHTGGGSHTYTNTTSTNYGVNVDGSGALSGYAWGASVGWINFDPANSGVTIDTATGEFDGYAWGENVGWIHCKGTAPVYGVVVNPDLEIAKQATSRVDPGGSVTYTIVFTNDGPVLATGVVVTDRIPVSVTRDSLVVVSSLEITPSGSISYVWQVEDLDAGERGAITITGDLSATLTGGHTFTNRAEIAAHADSDGGNDSDDADVTVTDAQLKITKEVSDPTPDPGATILYTVVVTNGGPDGATNMVVSDTLPLDVINITSSTTQGEYVDPVWDVGGLGAGLSATLRVTGTVRADAPDGTVITNTAVISASDQGDSGPPADREDVAVIVVRGAELSVVKTVDDPTPDEGSSVTYAITVTNDGFTATVVVSDALPGGVSYASDDGGGAYDGSEKWEVGELIGGESSTLHITATVDVGTAGTAITNSAAISETSLADPDSDDDADEARIEPQGADLEVVKTVDDCTPNEGSAITYTLIVTNHGPADTVDVVISDTLPLSVTYRSHSGDGAYDPAASAWDVGNLNDGTNETLRIVVTVTVGAAGQTITNSAAISESGRTDLFPANDTDSAIINVQEAEALEALITSGAGGTLTHTDRGLTTTVELPIGAVTDDVTLIYTPVPTPTEPIPGELHFANRAFDLAVYGYPDCAPLPGYAFKRPITITIHYSDADVAGLVEEELLLEYWNGAAWADAACGEYERYPDEKWLAVEICHLTQFALLGRAAPVGGYTEALMPLRPELVEGACPELVEGLLLLAAMVFAGVIARPKR